MHWRNWRVNEDVLTKEQRGAGRNFIEHTKEFAGSKAVTDTRRLMGIERPMYLGTNDHQDIAYLLNAGGHTGTKERAPQVSGYRQNQGGHTDAGDQEKWVLVEGDTATAGKAMLFDTKRGNAITMATALSDDLRLQPRQAARATGGEDISLRRERPRHSIRMTVTVIGSPCGCEDPPGCTCLRKPPS